MLNNTRRPSDGYLLLDDRDTLTEDTDGFEILKIEESGSARMDFFFCTDIRAEIREDKSITSDLVSGYYTFSCEMKTNATQDIAGIQFRIFNVAPDKTNNIEYIYEFKDHISITNDDQWHKVKAYLKLSDPIKWGGKGNNSEHNNCFVGFGFVFAYPNETHVYIKKAKLEYGRADNPIWTPSPADISLIYDRLKKVTPAEAASGPITEAGGSN